MIEFVYFVLAHSACGLTKKIFFSGNDECTVRWTEFTIALQMCFISVKCIDSFVLSKNTFLARASSLIKKESKSLKFAWVTEICLNFFVHKIKNKPKTDDISKPNDQLVWHFDQHFSFFSLLRRYIFSKQTYCYADTFSPNKHSYIDCFLTELNDWSKKKAEQ